MALKRDIKYVNRDFSQLRDSLIDYTKTYFPTTYNDFTQASPGMMMLELAAYVGDVLSFYTDNQLQESYLQYARQTSNLYQMAYMFGYSPKLTAAATTDVDFYQQVPAKNVSGEWVPDFSYALSIGTNAQVQTADRQATFLVQDAIDFSISSSADPTTVTIYSTSGGNPTYYLLKKTRKATSATINTQTFNFTTPVKFDTRTITADRFISILDVVDSNGNKWYEVDNLAQDAILQPVPNTKVNDSRYGDSIAVPNILKLKAVQRRFVTRVLDSNTIQVQFGAGTANVNDEEIVPNTQNIGLGLPYGRTNLTTAFAPTNFVFTNTYGIAPSNTTLTIRYLTGGGVTANVAANTLTTFQGTATFNSTQANTTLSDQIFNSLAVTNPQAASGGGDGDTVEEIRQNIRSSFNTQQRAVTPNDYLIRILSLPSEYGVVAKASVTPTKAQSNNTNSTLDAYILTYDQQGHLVTASQALKDNITTYINQFNSPNDRVSIKDAFIVNIGVDFEISTVPNINSNVILVNCINTLKNYFNTANWTIGQTIPLRDLYMALDRVEGVVSVKKVQVSNKVGESLGYSKYGYDIQGATRDSVIYPSLDPCIFEVKYPDIDITGRVVQL